MALAFRKVKRKIRIGKDQGKEKYFAVAKKMGLTPFNEVCELVSRNSSMSSADVKSVLDSLSWVICHELRGGRAAQVGELGNFRLTLSAEGQEESDKVTAHTVRRSKVIFSPGAELRDMVSKMTYVPYDEVIVTVEVPCNKPHM